MKISLRSLLPVFAVAATASFAQADESLLDRIHNEGMTITHETFDEPVHEKNALFQKEFIIQACDSNLSSMYLCALHLRAQGGVDMATKIKELMTKPQTPSILIFPALQ